jgi:hypothetical protein
MATYSPPKGQKKPLLCGVKRRMRENASLLKCVSKSHEFISTNL